MRIKTIILTSLLLINTLALESKASDSLFSQGISSGDPTNKSLIIWSKVNSSENTPKIIYEVSIYEDFRKIINQGEITTSQEKDFTFKVDIENLKPDTEYFYRFKYQNEYSPIGKSKTLPENTNSLRVAFVTCQNYGAGYFTSYKHILEDNPDVVVMLGDSIYESVKKGYRTDTSKYAQTLNDYREKYKMYLNDPYLKEIRSKIPFITTWDDHEVMNNYSGTLMKKENPQRLNDAYKAFFEYTPVREQEGFKLYRSFKVGDLLELFAIDGRQYRDPYVCPAPTGIDFSCTYKAKNDDITYLGKEQKEWLKSGLKTSNSTWKLLANNTMMVELSVMGNLFNFDQWDGYYKEKQELLKFIKDEKISNFVVFTGDFHTFAHNNINYNGFKLFDEYVVSSLTSTPPDILGKVKNLFDLIVPEMDYFEPEKRGYILADFHKNKAKIKYYAVSSIDNVPTHKILLKEYILKP